MTNFEKEVYSLVRTIKSGQTMTYAEVAMAIGYPRAARAVGNVLNKNHDPSVPCHRIIRSDGQTGGYNRGAVFKAKLLRKENAI